MYKTNFIKENDLCSLICNKYSVIKNNEIVEIRFYNPKKNWDEFKTDIAGSEFQQFLVNTEYYLICIHKQLTEDEFQSKGLYDLMQNYISNGELTFYICQADDKNDVFLKKSINDVEIYVTENKELVINIKHEF